MIAARHTVEEKATLLITRGAVSYFIKVSATFMEAGGEYVLVDKFNYEPKLPFDLTPADRDRIIEALYAMSDKRSAENKDGQK